MVKVLNLVTHHPATISQCRNPILVCTKDRVLFLTEDPEVRMKMTPSDSHSYSILSSTITTRTLTVIWNKEREWIPSFIGTGTVEIRTEFTNLKLGRKPESYALQRIMIEWDPLEARIRFDSEIIPDTYNQIIKVTKDLELVIFIKS